MKHFLVRRLLCGKNVTDVQNCIRGEEFPSRQQIQDTLSMFIIHKVGQLFTCDTLWCAYSMLENIRVYFYSIFLARDVCI